MTLVGLILVLALCGLLVWLILQIPMPPVFRTVIYAICVIFLILWLLQALGISTGLPRLRLS